jgi:hypothetical protein
MSKLTPALVGSGSILLVVFGCVLPGRGQVRQRAPASPAERTSAVPADMPALFDELVFLVRKPQLSVTENLRVTYLVTRMLIYAERGLPYMRSRFARCPAADEGLLAGAYVVALGTRRDVDSIHGRLENDPRARDWLKMLGGTNTALTEAMQAGMAWEPVIRLLPTGNCRYFTRLCMGSRDALLRRCGLYWGAWTADDAGYWRAVALKSKQDPDPLARNFAGWLLKWNKTRSR